MKSYIEMTDAERDIWREEKEEERLKEEIGDGK